MQELISDLEAELQSSFELFLEKDLREASFYAVFPGGKRIRPLIALALLSDLKVNPKELIQPLAALELIHCSTLVHDDLPDLDNDHERRGQAACHIQFGSGTAILTGDALIALAFLVLNKAEKTNVAVSSSGILSQALLNVCQGQQLDLLSNQKTITDWLKLFELKTASLFSAALEIASLVFPEGNCRANFKELGLKIGMLFQILDDHFDWEKQGQEAKTPNIYKSFNSSEIESLVFCLRKDIEEGKRKIIKDFKVKELRNFSKILELK